MSITEPNTELRPDQTPAIRDANLLQIQFAREYLLNMLGECDALDWFAKPAGCESNLAWQVGHLTVSQYGLALFRQRGRAEYDMQLMPSWFRKKFTRGSDPDAITPELISREKLLAAFNAVYDEVLQVVPTLTVETLNQPIDMPYAGYATNLGALMFCPLHEMIHVGQIGMLRRAHGLSPIR